MVTKKRTAAHSNKSHTRARLPIKAAPGKSQETTATMVRKMVVKNPALSFEQVAKRVPGEHEVGGHVWNLWNHTRSVMQIVEQRR